MLVANPIANGFAEIGSERMPALRFECVEAAEGAKPRVLNQVRRIGRGASPAGKTPVRPGAKRRQTAADQFSDGARIAATRAGEQSP